MAMLNAVQLETLTCPQGRSEQLLGMGEKEE